MKITKPNFSLSLSVSLSLSGCGHRVLYFSMHRYENGEFWPHLPESNWDHIGDGEGKGYNINIPWNKVRSYLCLTHMLIAFTIWPHNSQYPIREIKFGFLKTCYSCLLPTLISHPPVSTHLSPPTCLHPPVLYLQLSSTGLLLS